MEAVCAGGFDGAFEGFVIGVADGVDEEVVFPVDLFTGSFFDVCEVYSGVAEDVEDFGECAGFVGGGEEDCGFVVAGFSGGLAGDDPESGDVVGVVFDVFEEFVEAVELSGEAGADGGDAFFMAGEFGCGGGAGGGADFAAFGDGGEEFSALGEDFGFGGDDFDFVPGTCGQDVVVDGDEDFGADAGRGGEECVEGVDDSAVDGVFDGYESVVDSAACDLFEDGADVGEGYVVDGGAEFEYGGLVGEGAVRAEEADTERAFECEGSAHEFAVDGFEATVGEWAFVEGADAVEDGFFAVRGVDG